MHFHTPAIWKYMIFTCIINWVQKCQLRGLPSQHGALETTSDKIFSRKPEQIPFKTSVSETQSRCKPNCCSEHRRVNKMKQDEENQQAPAHSLQNEAKQEGGCLKRVIFFFMRKTKTYSSPSVGSTRHGHNSIQMRKAAPSCHSFPASVFFLHCQ